jgi:GDP-D-mannose dehydratase
LTYSQKCLIVGWPGQDAIFLYLHLRRRGYDVYCISSSEIFSDTKKAPFLPSVEAISALINEVYFHSIYFLQAFHKPYDARSTGEVGLYAAETLFSSTYLVALFIDALCNNPTSKPEKIFYASSRLALKDPDSIHDVNQEDLGKFHLTTAKGLGMCEFSSYSLAKLCGSGLLYLYAEKHDVAIFNLYFYNHESHFRPTSFFLPKLYSQLKSISVFKCSDSLDIGDNAPDSKGRVISQYNFSNLVDIGHCSQFMRAVAELTETESYPGFYNVELATGRILLFRDVVHGMAEDLGLSSEEVNGYLECDNISAASNHPQASLSFIKQKGIKPPSLCGFELGKVLAKDYDSAFRPRGLLDPRLFNIILY